MNLQKIWDSTRYSDAERRKFFNDLLEMINLAFQSEISNEQNTLEIKTLGVEVSKLRAEINALWEEADIDDDEVKKKLFSKYFDPLDDVDQAAVSFQSCSIQISTLIL